MWSASLDLSIAYAHEHSLVLSEDEIRRAKRFLIAKNRAYFICGRAVLRMLLGRYLDLGPEEVNFLYGPNAKPELSPAFHHGNLHFNVSHSHGQLLVAIARDYAVGVDLEMIRPELDFEKIVERFFSFEETQQLRTLTGSRKRDGFFKGWTRKEAYLKARGEGIAAGLNQFAVSLVPGEPARLLYDRRDLRAVSRWSLHELSTLPGYAAALAVEAADLTVRRFAWDAYSSASLAAGLA